MTWINTYKGEPCVSRHDIRYPSHFGDMGDESKYLVKKVMHEPTKTLHSKGKEGKAQIYAATLRTLFDLASDD